MVPECFVACLNKKSQSHDLLHFCILLIDQSLLHTQSEDDLDLIVVPDDGGGVCFFFMMCLIMLLTLFFMLFLVMTTCC